MHFEKSDHDPTIRIGFTPGLGVFMMILPRHPHHSIPWPIDPPIAEDGGAIGILGMDVPQDPTAESAIPERPSK